MTNGARTCFGGRRFTAASRARAWCLPLLWVGAVAMPAAAIAGTDAPGRTAPPAHPASLSDDTIRAIFTRVLSADATSADHGSAAPQPPQRHQRSRFFDIRADGPTDRGEATARAPAPRARQPFGVPSEPIWTRTRRASGAVGVKRPSYNVGTEVVWLDSPVSGRDGSTVRQATAAFPLRVKKPAPSPHPLP